jgi:hypothetical protein
LRFPDFAVALPLELNGARMPSIAEELATDLRMARSRATGSRRWGLVVVKAADPGSQVRLLIDGDYLRDHPQHEIGSRAIAAIAAPGMTTWPGAHSDT